MRNVCKARKAARRRGQILVVTCAFLPVVCILAAATVDVGHLCTMKAQLQNAADSAALASVMEMWDLRMHGQTEPAARDGALAEAATIADLNHAGGRTTLQFGNWSDDNVWAEKNDGVCVNAVRATVSRDQDAAGGPCRTFFARLFGIDGVEEQATAVARYRPKGFAPFGIYEPDVVGPGEELLLYDNDEPLAPGIFGLLDFDGGSNSADDTVDWIRNGYFGPLWIDPETGYLDVGGTPGWVSAIQPAVDYHYQVGDSLVACVYSDVWDNGANATFRVVGFIEVVVTSIAHDKLIDGKMHKYYTAEVQSKYVPGNGDTQGTMRDFMKLQLVE